MMLLSTIALWILWLLALLIVGTLLTGLFTALLFPLRDEGDAFLTANSREYL